MARFRTVIFLLILFFILSTTVILILVGRGYRLDLTTRSLKPNGLLLAASVPNGASVFIDGKLTTATDSPVSLPPGDYEIEIKKDSFHPWKKSIKIEKELVTKTEAYLFPLVPDLRPLTYTGVKNPVLSPDGSKIVYAAADASFWLADLDEGPFGFFTREPRLLLKNSLFMDFSKASFLWSPDSRQLLISSKDGKANFLLDPNQSPAKLVDINQTISIIKEQWQNDIKSKLKVQTEKLPGPLAEILDTKASLLAFSADQTKIFYTATASAAIPENLAAGVLGASTQKEERLLKPGSSYAYDLKEDRNFAVSVTPGRPSTSILSWFPTCRHLLLVEKDRISLVEYDGTNKQEVYSGFFEYPFVFSSPSANKLILLTRLTSDKTAPLNLYALNLK